MSAVMMACGHAANATHDDGPACAICAGIDPRAYQVAGTPVLAGRIARCGCGKEAPSDSALAFFEFQGEGSRVALERCANCGYAPVAHERKRAGEAHLQRSVCDEFLPHGPFEFDRFYCGCRGWD